MNGEISAIRKSHQIQISVEIFPRHPLHTNRMPLKRAIHRYIAVTVGMKSPEGSSCGPLRRCHSPEFYVKSSEMTFQISSPNLGSWNALIPKLEMKYEISNRKIDKIRGTSGSNWTPLLHGLGCNLPSQAAWVSPNALPRHPKSLNLG